MLLLEESLTVRELGGLCSLHKQWGPSQPPTLHRSSWSPGATWLFLHAPSWLNLGTLPELRRRVRDCFLSSLEIETHLGIQWEETPVREKEAGSRMPGWTFKLGIPSGGRRQAGRLGRSVPDCPTLWGMFEVLSWSSEDRMNHPRSSFLI